MFCLDFFLQEQLGSLLLRLPVGSETENLNVGGIENYKLLVNILIFMDGMRCEMEIVLTGNWYI